MAHLREIATRSALQSFPHKGKVAHLRVARRPAFQRLENAQIIAKIDALHRMDARITIKTRALHRTDAQITVKTRALHRTDARITEKHMLSIGRMVKLL